MSNAHASKKHGVRLIPRMRPHKRPSLKKAKQRARVRKVIIWQAVENRKKELEKQIEALEA